MDEVARAAEGLIDPRGYVLLDDIQRNGRQEFPVGQDVQTLPGTGDAGELLDVVVPGRGVGVADRPVGGDALFQVRLEIQIRQAIALPAPHQ
ncbi:hypothetical protein D9M72_646170 [compost metagenome]